MVRVSTRSLPLARPFAALLLPTWGCVHSPTLFRQEKSTASAVPLSVDEYIEEMKTLTAMDAFQPLFDLQMHYIYNRRTRPPPAGQYGSPVTAGAVTGAVLPPPPKRPRSNFLSFFFQVVHALCMRGGYPHTIRGAGDTVGYSPIKLVCDACGCRYLETVRRIAR